MLLSHPNRKSPEKHLKTYMRSIANLEEVRIVHGVGTGKLRAGIHEYLRTHRNVAEYRLGKYGEGETGVTIVKIR